MRKILLLNFLLIPFLIYSQSVKKIKNQLNNNSIETYYVLKSDKSIKHGLYKLVTNRVVLEKGNFTNNLKSGKWEIFHKNKTKSAEGDFENGKRIKIWKFYNNRNELIQTFDFETNILTNEGPLKEEKIKTGNGRFRGLLFTDKPPTFENGNIGIVNFAKENFKHLELNKTKGKIYVGGILLENGELKNLKVLKGINKILDNEAIRVTKLMEGKWSPAEFEGEKLRKKIVIPFTIE
jgi:hypothetical protein